MRQPWMGIGAGMMALCAGLALRADVRPVPPVVLHPALAGLPLTTVWAWERSEDLRWAPPDVAIAYVASSVVLRADKALVYPRHAALRVPAHAVLIPVLHVDASWHEPPDLSARQRDTLVAEMMRVAGQARHHVVQLDFEVRRSQRPFLAQTVRAMRVRLPRDMALSMTALASWCLDDRWLPAGLADEVVPMAFRMGPDSAALRRQILDQQGFNARGCTSAVGFASDEPMVWVRAPRRYYFSPRPWTPARFGAVVAAPLPTVHSHS